MAKREKTHLTTYEASALLGVTPQTVCNWIDNGRLSATRTAGGHRRIDRIAFQRFAREQGYAVDEFDSPRLVLVSEPNGWAQAFHTAMESVGIEIITCPSAFRAGFEVAQRDPNVVLISVDTPGVDVVDLVASLREQSPRVHIIILGEVADPDALLDFRKEIAESCLKQLTSELDLVLPPELPKFIL